MPVLPARKQGPGLELELAVAGVERCSAGVSGSRRIGLEIGPIPPAPEATGT